MSRLQELIQELCPDGVEYKTLGEVAPYSSNRIDADMVDAESYVGVDNLLPNKQGKTSSNYVPSTDRLTRFIIGDILIGNIRPYLKKIWLAENNGGTNGDVLVIHIKDEKEMIATVYKGNIIKNLIMDCQSYTKYRPNETTGGIFVSWRRKEELPTGA